MEAKSKIITIIISLFLIIFLFILFWNFRYVFTKPYDSAYWKDRFDHSQWQLTYSNRPIGDDGLYQYVGYQLIKGSDPSLINAEVPPFGKYLIGASIRLFNNGYIAGASIYILILFVLYLILCKLKMSSIFRLLAVFLLATDPLLIYQISVTMLDLPLFLCLLIFVLSLISFYLTTNPFQKWIYTISAGISIGLFAATKFPLLSIIPMIIGLSIFMYKKSYKHLVLFLCLSSFMYCLTFINYFFFHPNPIEFLRYQKWLLMFYKVSKLEANLGSAVTTLFVNLYQNLGTRIWEHAPQWSFTWPIVGALSLYILYTYRNIIRRSIVIAILLGLPTLFLLFYSFIPFFPRYLLLIVPFFYIVTVYFLSRLSKKLAIPIMLLLIVSNIYYSTYIIFPTPESDVRQFIYDFENGLFQDMYERIYNTGLTRTVFHDKAKKFYLDAEIESIKVFIEPVVWTRFKNCMEVPIKILFVSRNLGAWNESKTLHLQKINGQWKIIWDWNIILNMLTETSTVVTNVDLAKRGSIIINNHIIAVKDEPSFMVFIIANNIDKDQEEFMLFNIERYFSGKLSKHDIYARYMNAYAGSYPIAIGVPTKQLSKYDVNDIQKYQSIVLVPAYFRNVDLRIQNIVGNIENTAFHERFTTLYSTTNYDGVTGLERKYNDQIKGINGGILKIIDADGNTSRIIIEKTRKDGVDVFVEDAY